MKKKKKKKKKSNGLLLHYHDLGTRFGSPLLDILMRIRGILTLWRRAILSGNILL